MYSNSWSNVVLIVLKAIIMFPGLSKPRNCFSDLLYIWIPIYEDCLSFFELLEYEWIWYMDIWNRDTACACHVKKSIGIIIPMNVRTVLLWCILFQSHHTFQKNHLMPWRIFARVASLPVVKSYYWLPLLWYDCITKQNTFLKWDHASRIR